MEQQRTWRRLDSASGHMRRIACAPERWSGRGQVRVTQPAANEIVWHEEGRWGKTRGRELCFRNVYRWQRLAGGKQLALAHLRRGAGRPISLVRLVPEAEGRWTSIAPHHCGADCYTARLHVARGRLVLRWRITGPRKDLRLCSVYYGV